MPYGEDPHWEAAVVAARVEIEALRAENAKLKEALERIAAPIKWAERNWGPSPQAIARAALQKDDAA